LEVKMATINTPLALRWARARKISDGAVDVIVRLLHPDGDVMHVVGFVQAHDNDGSGYLCTIEVDVLDRKLIGTNCTCADFSRMADLHFDIVDWCRDNGEDPTPEQLRGIPLLHGVLVCKHTLKLAGVVYASLSAIDGGDPCATCQRSGCAGSSCKPSVGERLAFLDDEIAYLRTHCD
jgi:hypothetical protein